ncbi:MAG: class I SAM-dependent rRNA methyltransferase [Elusimicrobiota bacterium]
MYQIVQLKKDKGFKILSTRHPWIFSGAVEKIEGALDNGDVVSVTDSDGKVVATGMYSKSSMIKVRILEYSDVEIDRGWVAGVIRNAVARRELLGYGKSKGTTGYRMLYGESDGIPGLVIDRYGDAFVLQSSNPGADKLKPLIQDVLVNDYKAVRVHDRSDVTSRKNEGLDLINTVLYGTESDNVEFKENGYDFVAAVKSGQKTGFFLDQKDARAAIGMFAKGRKVLNLFSYTGASGIYAMRNGAVSVHNIDSSDPALTLCHKHAELNDVPADKFTTENADVFQWIALQKGMAFDMIILDPPALVKTQKSVDAGTKAYHFVNRAAIRLLNPGGVLVTSSCSQHFPENDFVTTLRRAAVQAERKFHVLRIIRQSGDHPASLYFSEALYLKTIVGIAE